MFVRNLAAFVLLFLVSVSTSLQAQTPVTQADIQRVKSEILLLKQDIEIKEAELRMLELQMTRQTTAAQAKTKPVAASKPTVSEMVTSSPLTTTTVQAPRRANVDPTPYEQSITGYVPVFRPNQSTKWLVLDEKRVVYWVLDDEAYLLTLALACEGLLGADKLKLERFSTKVRAGSDGVIVDDRRCLIESIAKLGGRKLPKAPRK